MKTRVQETRKKLLDVAEHAEGCISDLGALYTPTVITNIVSSAFNYGRACAQRKAMLAQRKPRRRKP